MTSSDFSRLSAVDVQVEVRNQMVEAWSISRVVTTHHKHPLPDWALWRLLPRARKRVDPWYRLPWADQDKPTQGISCGPCVPSGFSHTGQAWQSGRVETSSAISQGSNTGKALRLSCKWEGGTGLLEFCPTKKSPCLFFPSSQP